MVFRENTAIHFKEGFGLPNELSVHLTTHLQRSLILLVSNIYNCIVPLGFLPREIQVAFPGETQLRQIGANQPAVHAGCFSVSTIHRAQT